MFGIKDKVVVITGASSGIGEATAAMLAERGAKVVLGARVLDRLQFLARRIERAGGEVAYAQTDVRKREDLTSLVNLAGERYGKLDVLINNAGIGPISPLTTCAWRFGTKPAPSETPRFIGKTVYHVIPQIPILSPRVHENSANGQPDQLQERALR